MAATRSFVRSAVAAAVFVLLSACGGGEETPQVQTHVASPEVIKALSGPAVPDREGILAVSAPVSKVQPKFSLTAETKLAGNTDVAREQKLENVAEVSPVDKLFDWAEGVFPMLFPGHKTSVKLVAGVEYTLRYYPETQNYVGVTPDGGIYGLGPYTENTLKYLGHICDFSVTIDSCRPKVLSTSPANGAINVSAKGTSVDYVFGNADYAGEGINCAGVSGTSEVGTDVKVIVTISCRSASRTVTITPQDGRWPFGVEACLTLGGIQNLAGYGSLPVTTCFTTKPVQVTPAFYLGDQPLQDGSNAIHVMDPSTGAIVKEIGFPLAPAFSLPHRIVADFLSGQMMVVPWITTGLYLVDLENYRVSMLVLPGSGEYYLPEGAFLNGTNFCTAITKTFNANVWTPRNQVACWNRTTKKNTVLTEELSLADQSMRTLRIDLVGDKVYALNGLETAYDNSDFLWLPGKPGELRVLNPTTLALERKVKVGSVPVDFAIDPASGDAWIINGGDKSLSVVHPNGNVETTPMSGLSESPYQRPTNIVMNAGKGQVYITDGYQNVLVYDLTTRREVRRIPLGTGFSSPRTMLLRGKDLYVVLTNRATVMKVNTDTFEATTFTTSLGGFPGSLYSVGL